MSDQAKAVLAALMALPAEEREAVTDTVRSLDGLDEEELTEDEWHEAWAEEINRRVADLDAGRTKLIPHEEVMRELREKYG